MKLVRPRTLYNIWPHLYTPAAKTITEWYRNELGPEISVFGAYFRPTGKFSKALICPYSKDYNCRCTVAKRNKRTAELICSKPDEYVLACRCEDQAAFSIKVPTKELELYELKVSNILEDLARMIGATPYTGAGCVCDFIRDFGCVTLSDDKTIDCYLACSTKLEEILDGVTQLKNHIEGEFVLLVPEKRLVHSDAVKIMNQRKAAAVGLDELLTVKFPPNPITDPEELMKCERLLGVSVIQNLVEAVTAAQGKKSPKKVHKRTENAKENYVAWEKAALKLFEELDINNRNDWYFWKKNGKPRLYRFANKLREIHPSRNYFPAGTSNYSYDTAIPNKIVSETWKEYESEQDA